MVALIDPSFTPSLNPSEVVHVFDVPLSEFVTDRVHAHTDISYFGTAGFRVHHFKCDSNVLLVSPGHDKDTGLPVVEALQSGSFQEDKAAPAARAAAPLPTVAAVAGSVPLAACGHTGHHTVFGLTAAVLIQAAAVALHTEPPFALTPPDGMYWARPPCTPLEHSCADGACGATPKL